VGLTVYILGGLRYEISGPQAGSGTCSRVTGGFLYAATISLKRVTVMTFRISKYFHRSKSKLRYDFLNNKEAQKLKNHQRTYRKYRLNF
jgi:hypothetical protein